MAAPGKAAKRKRPSMYDVARAAGVSQTTVSFVVNNAPNTNIPPETRDRVWAAVEELGWRPNAMARGLSLQRSHTIGLISDEVATSPHAGKIIQGAQDAAWDDSKMLLVINTGGKPAIESAALEMMLERRVEGIIYATMYHHAVTPPPELAHVPTVLLDCFVDDRSLPSVVPDEVQGGRTAAELLLARGHRRIGFINDVGPIPASFGRLEGYRQALTSFGVPFDRDLDTQWSKYRFGRLPLCGRSAAAVPSGRRRCSVSTTRWRWVCMTRSGSLDCVFPPMSRSSVLITRR